MGALAIAAAAVLLLWHRSPAIVMVSDPCRTPPPLTTRNGVTLQPLAMTAFRQAERKAGERIPVVQSYRSCAEQRAACLAMCGNGGGCPGRCAAPGKSWHQLGAAIDTTQRGIDDPRIVSALNSTGWCQAVPDSDPGHFSFGGCH